MLTSLSLYFDYTYNFFFARPALDGREQDEVNKDDNDDDDRTRGEKKKNDSVEIHAIVFFSHFILITVVEYKFSSPFITSKLNGSPGLLTN